MESRAKKSAALALSFLLITPNYSWGLRIADAVKEKPASERAFSVPSGLQSTVGELSDEITGDSPDAGILSLGPVTIQRDGFSASYISVAALPNSSVLPFLQGHVSKGISETPRIDAAPESARARDGLFSLREDL